MTSHIKATITHNYPVKVELFNKDTHSTVLLKAVTIEESGGSFEIDQWFSGPEQVVISEMAFPQEPKEEPTEPAVDKG